MPVPGTVPPPTCLFPLAVHESSRTARRLCLDSHTRSSQRRRPHPTPSRKADPVKERRLHALLLCAAIIVFFHSVASFPFLSWDDDINVTGNPLISNPTLAGLSELWRHAYANLYVPVAYTWFW